MTIDGSTNSPDPGGPTGSPADADDTTTSPSEQEPDEPTILRTGPAALILGRTARTIERWIDDKKLRGGRPTDAETGVPVPGAHRWAEARHVVEIAVGSGLAHKVPEHLRHLIPQVKTGAPIGHQMRVEAEQSEQPDD